MTDLANSCNADEEVVFIDDNAFNRTCHAVVKSVNGPWSNNRVGFCGCEPDIGPLGWTKEPYPTMQQLCRACAPYVEQRADGKWYVKSNAPSRVTRRWTSYRHECGCDDD